jgi:formylglycine-generating enzyme required for sulfatase activity
MGTAPSQARERTLTAMSRIQVGGFRMGCDDLSPGERAAHRVAADAFWTDTRPATGEDFGRFVAAAGYQTVAELPPAADCPDADPDLVVADDEFAPAGTQLANPWQGGFPCQNLRPAGYDETPLAGTFPANGFRCVIRSGPLLAWPGGRPAYHSAPRWRR